MPAGEVADGALVILGGALLLTPGFLTDAVGLLCLLPGSRTVLRRLLTGVVARRLGGAGVAGMFAAERLRRRPSGRAKGPTTRRYGAARWSTGKSSIRRTETDPPPRRAGL